MTFTAQHPPQQPQLPAISINRPKTTNEIANDCRIPGRSITLPPPVSVVFTASVKPIELDNTENTDIVT